MEAKKPWQSKTLWVNLLLAVAAFIPAVSSVVKESPDMAGLVITMVNVILRFVTKDKIQLVDDEPKNDKA